MMCVYVHLYIVLFVDSHVLVHFDDENACSIVPVARIQKTSDDLSIGGKCLVMWHNKKIYDGTLMHSGMAACLCALLVP